MADDITITAGGQSIPAALAASPASKKARVKAAKPVKVEAVPPEAPHEHPLAALVEAEAAIEAGAHEPAPEPTTEFGVGAPEPEALAPEPDVAPAPPAAVPAEPQKEIVMATTIENVTTDSTAKAQAMFADAGERAKGAMAKSAKLFEEAGAFGKGNVEALVESSKIAAKGFETLGQDVAEFTRKSFEEATAAFKTMASVKSPTELMKLQSDYVRQSFDALVAETSRSTEQVLKLAGEVAQPISNRLAVAAEKMKTAA
jgi:phasin family protein